MKNAFTLLLVLVASLFVHAQDFRFEASVNKTSISSSENIKLTLSLSNAKASGRMNIPKLTDWQIVSGPSTQNSVNIVNGNMTSTYSEVYVLHPLREGQLQIPEVTVQTDKGKLATKPITISVVKGNAPTAPSNPNSPPQPQTNSNSTFFIEVELNKSKVYVGEPVLASYRFYSAEDPRQIEKADYPALEGFWSEDLETEINVEATVINGRRLYTGVVKRQLLFPQISGKLEIKGFEMQMIVATGGSFFFRQNARVSDSAPKVAVEVLPYPAGKPGDLLGTFSPLALSVTTDVTELKANEAINLKATFSGKGNLKLLDKLPFEFPNDFEVFEPKTKDNISISSGGESGSRTFEYILIPRVPGDFEIPGISLNYFDPSSKTYKTLSSELMHFHVEKGSDNTAGNYTYDSRSDVQILNQDIRFIKNAPGEWINRGGIFLGTIPFYGLLSLPVVLFLLVLSFRKRRDDEESDIVGTQRKKAGKTAKKHLTGAANLLSKGDRNGFHQELLSAMNSYLSHKFSIPMSEHSKTKIKEYLSGKWDGSKVNSLISLLEQCEFARFSGTQNSGSESLLKQAGELIEDLEKTFN